MTRKKYIIDVDGVGANFVKGVGLAFDRNLCDDENVPWDLAK